MKCLSVRDKVLFSILLALILYSSYLHPGDKKTEDGRSGDETSESGKITAATAPTTSLTHLISSSTDNIKLTQIGVGALWGPELL